MIWIILTTEVFPYNKYGGLGDYVWSFSMALADYGIQTHVYTPCYEAWMKEDYRKLKLNQKDYKTTLNSELYNFSVFTSKLNNVSFHFIKQPAFFSENMYYVDKDGNRRSNICSWMFFGKASLVHLLKYLDISLKSRDYIIQTNDYYSSFIAHYINNSDIENKSRFFKLFYIHNFGKSYIGRIYPDECNYPDFKNTSLKDAKPGTTWVEHILPLYDKFITVSSKYCEELTLGKSKANRFLYKMKQDKKFAGFINGIDQSFWSIHSSPYIRDLFDSRFSPLEIKKSAKILLKQKYKVNINMGKPLFTFIGRLRQEKGLQYINELLLCNKDYYFVILGEGDNIDNYISHEVKERIIHIDKYSEKICHLLYAASDYNFVTSDYEPCGYVAMYSTRFGAIPVLHSTGGLYDIGVKIKEKTGISVLFSNLKEMNILANTLLTKKVHKNEEIVNKLININWSWDNSIKDIINFVAGSK